ncbi:RNA-binding protein with multiple splicing 2 [Ananas comosus]|uniref:RNA-binding protein with multiple splicing 2 n=1 Tax=Ananas comosus TaxID=4615 RepID=A0A199VZE7_ANACO|nr:RNA-binding protein with multiple splicing 2 [Ananas comosus]
MARPGLHHYHHHHQQWPPHPLPPVAAPPPPPPAAIAVDSAPRPSSDEVRTIFITGLPADVKERELHNLLRWLPGFEASQINFKGEQPMGFALFSTVQYAVAAKDALQDLVFDSETKSALHTEMAKKNLFVKRGVSTDPNPIDQSKRLRTGGDYGNTGYQAPPLFHQSPTPVWGTSSYMAPPPPYPYGGYPVPPNTKDNPPCNTLFIGNLGENVIEDELRSLFSVQPGYKQMKVLRQERNTVCFIEFDDMNTAAAVHHNLQGAVIPSSGRGGMRIQYPSI